MTGPKWPHDHSERHRQAALKGWETRRAKAGAGSKGQGRTLQALSTSEERLRSNIIGIDSALERVRQPGYMPKSERAGAIARLQQVKRGYQRQLAELQRKANNPKRKRR